jgi:hypothetical protein
LQGSQNILIEDKKSTKSKKSKVSRESSSDDSLKEELKKLKAFKNEIKAKLSQSKLKQSSAS